MGHITDSWGAQYYLPFQLRSEVSNLFFSFGFSSRLPVYTLYIVVIVPGVFLHPTKLSKILQLASSLLFLSSFSLDRYCTCSYKVKQEVEVVSVLD